MLYISFCEAGITLTSKPDKSTLKKKDGWMDGSK